MSLFLISFSVVCDALTKVKTCWAYRSQKFKAHQGIYLCPAYFVSSVFHCFINLFLLSFFSFVIRNVALAPDNMAAYFDGIALTSFFEDLSDPDQCSNERSTTKWSISTRLWWVLCAARSVSLSFFLSYFVSSSFNQGAWVRFPLWASFFFPSRSWVRFPPATVIFFKYIFKTNSKTHPLIVLIYTLWIQRGCDVWEQQCASQWFVIFLCWNHRRVWWWRGTYDRSALSLFQFDSNLFLSAVSNHDADRCAKCFGGWAKIGCCSFAHLH